MAEQRKILFLGDINSIHLQKWIFALKDDFQLFVFSLDPLENDTIDLNGVTIYTNESKTVNQKNKLSYLSSIKRFKKIHKEIAPDIVHAHYATSYGLMGAFLKPSNYFISVWGSDVYEFPKKSFIHKMVFKWIIRKANKLFSTSHDMKRELENYTSKNINVIPFGIDIALFKSSTTERNKQEFIVGTVKALEDVYGIDRLIDAFSILQEETPNSRLFIYGKGSKRKDLEDHAVRLKLTDKIDFKGVISNESVPEAIANMDVFCVLSRQESFGVSVIEAAACEKPVVGMNVGGLPEVIENGKTGYLVESAEEAAEKLIVLSKDSDLREELGKNARSFVLENYNWQKNVELMISFYTLP